jgi:hypothetical protein
MKKMTLVLSLVMSVSVFANKIDSVKKQNIDHFEISNSFSSLCSYKLALKKSPDQTIESYVGHTQKGKSQIKIPGHILEQSDYAVLMLNCGLNPVAIMFLGDDLDIVEDQKTFITIESGLSVVMKDQTRIEVPTHHSKYQALRTENAWGEKSFSFEDRDHLYLDMVKFE